MGADGFADENGEFEIVVTTYRGNRFLGSVVVSGLQPKEPVDVEWIKGEQR